MVTIYVLRCVHTNEVYVGCTAGKLGKRMREHRCLLNQKKHASIRLQKLWDEHGPSAFRMECIQSLEKDCPVIEKREAELDWMKHYQSSGLLLNDNLTSFSPPKHAHALAAKKRKENGYSPSPETREKMRLAQLGIPKNHGAKISATKQAKNRL